MSGPTWLIESERVISDSANVFTLVGATVFAAKVIGISTGIPVFASSQLNDVKKWVGDISEMLGGLDFQQMDELRQFDANGHRPLFNLDDTLDEYVRF
jgi:hypothetical protein